MASQNLTDTQQARRLRVVLGATCYADAEGALSLAVEIARQVNAELHGLLVRDEGILTAAGRPRASVVSYSGYSATTVDQSAMLRAYQADARRFEERLSGLATSARIVAQFRAIEGRIAEVVEQSVAQGDVAVFGIKRAMRDSGSVILILGGNRRLPGFAGPLAAGLNKRLIVLSGASRQDEINEWATRHECPVPEAWQYEDSENLLRLLDSLSPAAVIVAADPSELPSATRILDAARCPVIYAGEDSG